MDPLGMKTQPRTIPYWWMICIFNWLYLLSLFKCGQLWMGRTLVLVMSLKDIFSKTMLSASLNTSKELDSGDWTVQTKVIHEPSGRPWLLMDGESELGLAAMCKCVVCKLTSWWCEDVGYIWESQGGNWSLPRLLVQDEKYIAFSDTKVSSMPLLTGYIPKPSHEEDFWWLSFS